MHMNDHNTVIRARELRNSASPPERRLWAVLQLEGKKRGLHFRRQQPLEPYIVDFASLKAKLAVEIDGWSHDQRQGYDAARSRYLGESGFTVLRFMNDDVMQNVEGVVQAIVEAAENLISGNPVGNKRSTPDAPHPNPPRKGEGTSCSVGQRE